MNRTGFDLNGNILNKKKNFIFMVTQEVKGTVIMKTRGVNSGFIQSLFSMGGNAHHKMLILLKKNVAIYKKQLSTCMGQQWFIAWTILYAA